MDSTPRNAAASPLPNSALRASFSRRASMPSVTSAARTGAAGVDPCILKKLSASVSSHCLGPRKSLSYVVSVETLVPGRRAFQEEREACRLVTRSADDFARFRKSLLTRVGGLKFDASAALLLAMGRGSGRCYCEGRGKGCAFDATASLLERLRFSRAPFLGLGTTEEDLTKRQLEMNNFLRVVFAVLHRMQPSAWRSDCLFLRDVLAFLEVEERFFEQVDEVLKHKNRQLGLQGWKAHSRDTFGSGLQL
ncbi:hypothetical protein PybrP1_012605 [[Pythium] brassicae (nom. inval.)]|nr:hypothetical protein PybrP1_012605 [[Pythium] brassicae (nom. inval.)]